MIEFNNKNMFMFNQAGITCLIKRVLDDDVEQFYVTDDLKGLSLYEECCIRPLYNEGMEKKDLYCLYDNLCRFANAKLRSLEFNRKTDTQWQPQQYHG